MLRRFFFFVLFLTGCPTMPPSQFSATDCEEAKATFPTEVTSDPNVNVVLLDNSNRQVLVGAEIITWDGLLVHKIQTSGFYCVKPQRTLLALEAAPGLHKVQVLIKVFGNPETVYDRLYFDVKSDYTLEIPDQGVLVLNVEMSLVGPPIPTLSGTLSSPQLRYREDRLPRRGRPR